MWFFTALEQKSTLFSKICPQTRFAGLRLFSCLIERRREEEKFYIQRVERNLGRIESSGSQVGSKESEMD